MIVPRRFSETENMSPSFMALRNHYMQISFKSLQTVIIGFPPFYYNLGIEFD